MNKTIYILLFNLLSIIVVGQSNIRINNFLENPYYINPAAIDDESTAVFSMAARKQWVGFPGAPSTIYATGTTYLENLRTQFGIKVFNDKIGISNTFNVALSYAYNVKLYRQWQLHLGLAASFQNLSYDLSDMNSVYVDDPSFYSKLLKQNNYNSDLGAQLTDKSLTVGLSTQNLFSLFFEENKLQTNANYLYAKYRYRTLDPIQLQAGVTAIQFNRIFQMEFNLTTFFNTYRQKELFQLGMFYRTRTEMGVLFGLNLGESLHAWYSFDYNVAGISKNTVGTHELMLVYKLERHLSRNY
ncbi:MAG: PorP/SprF family type IX secretion system membrane protein [Paludibacter sp.]